MAPDLDQTDMDKRRADAREDADSASQSATNLPGESASFDSDHDDKTQDLSEYDDRRRLSPEEQADEHVDKQLDHGLKETFPASDPVSINPGAD